MPIADVDVGDTVQCSGAYDCRVGCLTLVHMRYIARSISLTSFMVKHYHLLINTDHCTNAKATGLKECTRTRSHDSYT